MRTKEQRRRKRNKRKQIIKRESARNQNWAGKFIFGKSWNRKDKTGMNVVYRKCKHCSNTYYGTAYGICSVCGRFQ